MLAARFSKSVKDRQPMEMVVHKMSRPALSQAAPARISTRPTAPAAITQLQSMISLASDVNSRII